MAEIEIESVQISWDGNRVTFQDRERRRPTVSVSASGLGELLDFLYSLQLDNTEQRTSFRVPVPPSSSLSANLAWEGATWSVRVLNLSLVGMLVEFPQSAPAVPVDAEVAVILRVDDKAADIGGVVRRCNGNQYGILFPVVLRDEELDPPDGLALVCRHVERQWLRERLGK